MSATITCTACGTVFRPGTTPGGMCPTCLLARGAGSGVGDTAGGTGTGSIGGGTGAAGATATAAAGSGRGRPEPPTPAELGPLFPQLIIEELLGRGGMGAVYRARQKELDRSVALKVLPVDTGRDPDFAERFRREARALAGLSHPGIVGVHDFGLSGDVYWILMEFVDGITLRELMADGPVVPSQALSIVRQLCDTLAYAHGRGVVHRDIKPENILIDTSGVVRVVDFGLARLLDQRADELALTMTGQRMGTPHYMAPEQWEDPASVDHRADIYALGVVFYELLTHELPVGRFGPPSQKVHVSVGLDRVVLKALERDRERRYQATADMRTDVDTQMHAGTDAEGRAGTSGTSGTAGTAGTSNDRFTGVLAGIGLSPEDLAEVGELGRGVADVADSLARRGATGSQGTDDTEGADDTTFEGFYVGVFGLEGAEERLKAREARALLPEAEGGAALRARLLWLSGTLLATLGGAGAWQALMFLDWPGTISYPAQRWLLLWGGLALVTGLVATRVARRTQVLLEREAGQQAHRTWPERRWLLLGLALLGMLCLWVGNQAGLGTIPRRVLHTAGPSLFLLGGVGLLALVFIWVFPRRTGRRAEFVVATLLLLAPWGYLLHVRSEEMQQNEAMLAEIFSGTVPLRDGGTVPVPPTGLDLQRLAAGGQVDGDRLLLAWVRGSFEARDLASREEATPARWTVDFAEPARSPPDVALVFDAEALVDGVRTGRLARSFVQLGSPHSTVRASLDVDLRELLGEALDRDAARIVPILTLRVVRQPAQGVASMLEGELSGGTVAEWVGEAHTVFIYPKYPADYPQPLRDLEAEAGMRRAVTPDRVVFDSLVQDADGERAVRLRFDSMYLSGALPAALEIGLAPTAEWMAARGSTGEPVPLATGGQILDVGPHGRASVQAGGATRYVEFTLHPPAETAAVVAAGADADADADADSETNADADADADSHLTETFLLDLGSGRMQEVDLIFRGSREQALATPLMDRFWAADFRVTVPVTVD